ncbi:PTS sugar transporter subunit IIA [Clostridium sp. AL.422]|uniref:PTS sugar transporter subunit IIA n=1 Tax=Clostridium TaxID=1485 RepID=UPI00293DC46D|nr:MULTISPECIES: PTS sugar transporter subunit IIA [unclassified Clostridium]MDV4149927.1 PTS sugar transporter subunit IIA [Clostridium sp. AL.422]
MSSNLLTERSDLFDIIEVNDTKYKNWEEVIDYLQAVFVSNGYATKDYFQYIKTDLIENEFYMLIVPGLVLLHSSPAHGAIKNAFHFMKLSNPITFGDHINNPVHVCITFSAISSDNHIQSIQKIAYMLMNKNFVNEIKKADSLEKIKEIIKNNEDKY